MKLMMGQTSLYHYVIKKILHIFEVHEFKSSLTLESLQASL